MPDRPPAIEVYPVHHLPIIKAYADKLSLVNSINHLVPTEMEVDVGTVVLGLVLDTLSGRSPLYREDGNASDKPLNTTLLSEIAQLLARHGVAPGAYIYMAIWRTPHWSPKTISKR